MRPTTYHALGPAFLASSTLRHALERAARYGQVCADSTRATAVPVGDEFVLTMGWPDDVHLADDLIYSDVPCLKQMSDHFERYGSSVLGVETVPRDQTGSYGIVAVEERKDGQMVVTRIVEKPAPADAPSNLAVVGRYILTPRIFEELNRTGRGAGGEIQLTDGIASLLSAEPVSVLPFTGTRYDCGSKIGYLRATVEYGLRHPELGENFRAYLQGVWER